MNLPYVIITSKALASAFAPLVNWRTANGRNARVVSLEDIEANTVPDAANATFWQSTGYLDGGTRDLQEAVRNFIKWAYVQWQTEFVLLGGDTSVVPDRKGFVPLSFDSYNGSINASTTANLVSSPGTSVSASSSAAASSPNNVTDNNPATYWSCAAGDAAPAITLTFLTAGLPLNHTSLPVNRLELDWGPNAASAYTVQVSVDGQTWTTAYHTTTGASGNVSIPLTCRCAVSVRLQIQSGTNFQLGAVKIFGPQSEQAYAVNATCSRIYLSGSNGPNLLNTPPDQLLIAVGPLAGTVIPYLPAADGTTLGWHFVNDLCSVLAPAADSSAATPYLEICGPAKYHGNAFTVKNILNYIPADLYYADLSSIAPSGKHDWDADNNGIYGENYSAVFGGSAEIDGVNGVADVYVGRFLVSTLAEAATMVNKVIHYEMYRYPTGAPLPAGFANSALLVAGDWAQEQFQLDVGQCCEDIRTMLAGAGAGWTFARLYDTYWMPYAAVIPAANDPAGVQPLNEAAVVTALKAGGNLVSLNGRGNPAYLFDVQGAKFLQLADVAGLSNAPGIWFGNASHTNWFDKETLPSIGSPDTLSRVATLNPQGGAVAYAGYSRYGFATELPEKAFWNEMLSTGLLGMMLESGRMAFNSAYAKYSLNLIGDPAMHVWTAPPAAPVLPALNIPHVIITSQALAAAFQPLADWRTQNGLTSRVVAVESIQANAVPDTNGATYWFTSGYADGGTRDLQEAIRNFVKWAAVNWQTEFVLLGGETNIVPDRKAFVANPILWYSGSIDTPTTANLTSFAQPTVTASSSAPGTSPGNVTGGDPATFWSCAPGDAAPAITLTFSLFGLPLNHTTLPVNRIELDWGTNAATAYVVQVSADNQTWTTVYSTTTGAAGAVTISFPCVCAVSLRLQIRSGAGFQLAAWKVFGPQFDQAYAVTPTCTRIYLSGLYGPNPANTPPDKLLIAAGPRMGTIVPYLPATNSATPGWHFVNDIGSSAIPAADSAATTPYLEICGPAEYHGNAFTIENIGNNYPTDLYYVDLDATTPAGQHDWDANNNLIYGENYDQTEANGNIDGVNGLATVYVGRYLVNSPATVAIVVNKAINYEKYCDATGAPLPAGFATAVLLVAAKWALEPFALDSGQFCEEVRATLVGTGGGWTFTRLYDAYWMPYAAVIPAADDPASVLPLNEAAVVTALTAGNNLVWLNGHGNPNLIAGYGEAWFIQLSDVAGLSNVPSVWFGNACMTNWFDNETLASTGCQDTLSRVATLNPQGGAVAYVGYSRDGLTTGACPQAFWDEMLYSGLLGVMLESAHEASGTAQLLYALNLIGDPATKVWTVAPE